MREYITFCTIALDEILPLIRHKGRAIIKGKEVNINSVRLRTFKANTTCVSCGRKATHFNLEKGKYDNSKRYHLNLYSKDILMTKDHIIPKSLGGSNGLHNMQTMCLPCNQKKGNGFHSYSTKGKKQKKVAKGRNIIYDIKQGDLVAKKSRKLFSNKTRVFIVDHICFLFILNVGFIECAISKDEVLCPIKNLTTKQSEIDHLLRKDLF
jgi:5-methylcytosine-specific restriction endonuclease McrA